jgi:SAM-dependent methyltransferase
VRSRTQAWRWGWERWAGRPAPNPIPARSSRPAGWRAVIPALVLLACAGCGALGESPGPAPDLGAYLPTPPDVVERMLDLARVTPADVVYDLGSGDGRIVIQAAKRGARGVGVEIDPKLVWFARRAARREQVESRVTFVHRDALTVDVSPATVVTLYLTPQANLLLRPILQRQLRPGARIVSHNHDMGDWVPARTERVRSDRGDEHVLYLWEL